MRLFVYMFGSLKRIRSTSIVASSTVGVAIQFFGAPPVLLFILAYGGAALASMTQNWVRRHPDPQ
ncbi:MAG: hypothetical protein ACOYD4_11025 [Solirubrobacterales bacterium]